MVGMEKIVFNRVATVLTVLYVIRFLASVLRVPGYMGEKCIKGRLSYLITSWFVF